MSTILEPKISLETIPMNWRAAPRRWGHPLHSMCSYFAMFPPQLAHYLIAWLTSPGDTIYDPFSGRGTSALEAIMLNRKAYASDLNPMATVLTKAKLDIPSQKQLERRLNDLCELFKSAAVDTSSTPPDITMLYSANTLRQLIFLKSELKPTSFVDNFILACALGTMHANHTKSGEARGFSISMPNTFAMSPAYVRRYIAEHGLVQPEVNVFEMLRAKIQRYELPNQPIHGGRSWQQDATAAAPTWLRKEKVKLVLTSPPYLEVIKYGKYNWVRLWLLDQEAKAVDETLMASGSMARYIEFMSAFLLKIREVVTDDGYVCLVIGDVRRNDEHINLAKAVWDLAAKPQGWYLHSIIADELPPGVKVSRIWKNNIGRATKTDRILLMSPREVEAPEAITIDWDKPSLRN